MFFKLAEWVDGFILKSVLSISHFYQIRRIISEVQKRKFIVKSTLAISGYFRI